METKILWFTGLSGSGKTTVANLLIELLKEKSKSFKVFDGDDVRNKLHRHLGFSEEDIKENNKLILELCNEEFGNVDFILVPIISPFKESREKAREKFKDSFVEVHLDASYEECKGRDVKGLYKKAEEGLIENFIGLHVPYESPENPEISLKTSIETPEESCNKILEYLGL